MKVGAVVGKGEQIDLETGEIGLHSTPTVAKDVDHRRLVVPRRADGQDPQQHQGPRARLGRPKTGKLLWTFNTIPRPGEFGNDTWEKESWAINGNTGVWTQITVDEELGLVYLPVEDPTSDLYGGHRPGNNLFGDSLVCVDLKTGQRKWHYPDRASPDLGLRHAGRAAARRHQRRRQADQGGRAGDQAGLPLRVRSRHRPAGVADRGAAGAADRRARARRPAPTQPFPTKPPAYSRNGVVESDLIDFTPELKAAGLEAAKRYRLGPGVSAAGRQQARRTDRRR